MFLLPWDLGLAESMVDGWIQGSGGLPSPRFRMEKVGSWFYLCRMSSCPQGKFWSCADQEPFLGGGGGLEESLADATRHRETVHEHTQDNTEESSEPFSVGRRR